MTDDNGVGSDGQPNPNTQAAPDALGGEPSEESAHQAGMESSDVPPSDAVTEESVGGGSPGVTLSAEELQAQLEQARGALYEREDQALRLRAEMDNLRKRAERDLEKARKQGLASFLEALLPVKDSLELGLGHAEGQAEDDATGAAQLREGMELTLKMLNSVMEKFGLTELDPIGAPFDPEYHQAMSIRDDGEDKSGTVLTVVQKGYLLNERLVRPAMVVVAK